MHLIIDVGNTRIKLAIFDGDVLQNLETCTSHTFLEHITKLSTSYRVKKAIVSSVGKLDEVHLRTVQLRFPTVVLKHTTKLPITLDYKTPETLGVDRIGLACAFAKAYPKQNGLVIDAGSCITYEFITDEAVYKGGVISPGLQMRYKALHTNTAGLPLLQPEWPSNEVGDDTKTAIHHGVSTALVFEIEGFIEKYQKYFDINTVVITGGDAEYLAKRLKNSIFAHSNFLLEGLNYILTYQND